MAAREPKAAKAGGSAKMIVIILIVLLLGAGGAIGWLLLKHKNETAEGANAAPAAPAVVTSKTPLYLALDPAFVVNFRDEGSLRFLQVGVQVMAHEQAALDAVKANEPAIRDALILLFSSQDASVLAQREGKDKLRADALVEVQKLVTEQLGRPGVDAVYFTAFVMQ